MDLDGLLQELTAIYPYETLVQMYEEAVNDQPYSFLFINLKKPKEEMFSIRFEEILQTSKEETDGSFPLTDYEQSPRGRKRNTHYTVAGK